MKQFCRVSSRLKRLSLVQPGEQSVIPQMSSWVTAAGFIIPEKGGTQSWEATNKDAFVDWARLVLRIWRCSNLMQQALIQDSQNPRRSCKQESTQELSPSGLIVEQMCGAFIRFPSCLAVNFACRGNQYLFCNVT